jgi:hypothetical protein
MLKIDGHDDAILGPACIWRGSSRVDVLVCDAELIRESLMRDGMTSEDAREFIEFNIECAYVGEDAPILVWTQDMWDEGEEE